MKIIASKQRGLRVVPILLGFHVVGCGGQVNLGGTPPASSSAEPQTEDSGIDSAREALPAATILRFDSQLWGCVDLVVDDRYVYFSSSEAAGPSVRRCLKTDCAATVTRLAGPLCVDCSDRLAIAGGRLGIIVETQGGGPSPAPRIDSCTVPNCGDVQEVIGDLPEITSVWFEATHAYWGMESDRSIYRCALPGCAGGPEPIVRGIDMSGALATDREFIYWHWRGEPNVLGRKRKDGGGSADFFHLGPTLSRLAADAGRDPGPDDVAAQTFVVDGSWLYALAGDYYPNGTLCNGNGPCAIFRWPLDPLGEPNQIVFQNRAPIDFQPSSMRVFDGEIVFRQESGGTVSCRADECSSTLRALSGGEPGTMAIDGDNLYWCEENGSQPGTIERAPRIRN